METFVKIVGNFKLILNKFREDFRKIKFLHLKLIGLFQVPVSSYLNSCLEQRRPMCKMQLFGRAV